ncbi:MAG: 50S ribosomal protein L3 [Candidatus Brocadia sp.]|jgi:large subunit ribosomal protein L3|nr:50S ribosomal protein L3 [Candidatus Brocadia fulgida]MCC6325660.1 50S ribosomal protein L3 [Candidatus Brocadia sp.]MCE7912019.1 50S ribosomal protein L3 [Candidatus Brocadia sp. AMX3]OQY98458.1 MAG: 50S ribosomal protein L3 [Candidatus Brocadia sp. UTAMX2]MDG5997091.1 50S ribosomal protein L3 [Candidatus Brocadia sp.]
MLNGFLGKKIGMTQIYSDDGALLPVTLIQAGPCSVMQIKTVENDGYSAVQLGFDDRKKKHATKSEIGHGAKMSLEPKRFIREIRSETGADVKLGQRIGVDILQDVKTINVIGITKGKGYAGVMKRWNFKGGLNTHGSTRHRPPGSIGSNTDPGRVIRGKKMAGRLGGERVTIKNIDIIKIDAERNLLFVKGAVPGHKGSYLILNKVKAGKVGK